MKARILKTVGVVMAMVMSLGMTAMAAPSSSTDVSGGGSYNGNRFQAIISVTAESKKAAATIQTADGLKAAMGSIYAPNMKVLQVVDIKLPEGVNPPVEMTFSVGSVKTGDKGYMLHWNGSGWDAPISASCGNGTMTATLEKFSPYAFVVLPGGKSSVTSDGSTSPKTSPKTSASSTTVIALLGLCAVAGVVGLKKRNIVK